MTTQLSLSPIDEIRCQAVESIASLLNDATVRQPRFDKYRDLQTVLEALPLPTDEFAKAMNRFRNAQTYLNGGEWGAASYELRMLARSLIHYR